MLADGFIPDSEEWEEVINGLPEGYVRPVVLSAVALLQPSGRRGGQVRTWTYSEWCDLGQLADAIEVERRKIQRSGDQNGDRTAAYEKAVRMVADRAIAEKLFARPVGVKRIEQLLAPFRVGEWI